MKSLYELCQPRADVFEDKHQDDVLDLANLTEDSIDADLFFEETYFTDGMKQLVDLAFQRFAGIGATGLIRLKQAMGGGKTHNMITLGLLAKHPELREKYAKNLTHDVHHPIKVISFTGRNNDVPFGIWGEIAAQLSKKEMFSDYYTPLAAPGQNSWIRLLKDEPVLIMLDELPPYFEYLKTRQIGDGTLADVTVTALSNLFNAVNKAELSNVCIVVSDLKSTYEAGSGLLEKTLRDLEGEIGRSATDIEPVKTSSDDLYFILKQKLFAKLPKQQDIIDVAVGYKDAVNKAKQMNYTGINANMIYEGICQVYPFHPCIKDLFARFKENSGFQQTRGFIRLARYMVRTLFKDNGALAKTRELINAYDFDLSDSLTYSMISNIKSKLVPAIAHDIYSQGRAAAEEIDASDNSQDMQEIAKLLLMSSLSDVLGSVLGLTVSEVIGYMVKPGRDMSNFKQLIERFSGKAWYLYNDKNEKLYFKEIQNVNAKLNTYIQGYNNEQAKQEIKHLLEVKFAPKTKDCYQKILVFPGIDDIQLFKDNVTLVLFEPNPAGGLPRDLQEFFLSCNYPNRVMFLSGQHDTMNDLLEAAKEQKAISNIIKELKDEKVTERDTQYLAALGLADRIAVRICSAINETFVKLYYPAQQKKSITSGGDNRNYRTRDIEMKFENNDFNPETQIRNLLIDAGKFTTQEKTQEDIFKKKIEAKLFTANPMRWADLQERAAINTDWNWYYPSALKDAKDQYVANGFWAEDGDMLDKNPPLPKTSVAIREISRDEQGFVTLKLIPSNGDVVYWEINQPATKNSSMVKDCGAFLTNDMVLYFYCEDSSGMHEAGECSKWENNVSVKHRFYDANGSKYCELQADNPNVQIRYSTDGSNPRGGGIYVAPFIVTKEASLLQAVTYYKPCDLYGEILQQAIPAFGDETGKQEVHVDKDKPLQLKKSISYTNNKDVYTFINDMKKYGFEVYVSSINIEDMHNKNHYLDIGSGDNKWSADVLEQVLSTMREGVMHGIETKVGMELEAIQFTSGQQFLDWVALTKAELEEFAGCIKQ